MCDATSLGKMVTVSSAVSSIGNLMEGSQGKAFYNFKGEQANADAAYERGAAEVRASRIRKAGRLQQGEVRAAYAGSGIDVTRGTPVAVGAVVQRDIALDATMQLLTGERRAKVLESEAQGYSAAGERTMTTGYLNASRSLLSGTAQAMQSQREEDKWIRRRNIEFAATKRAQFTGFEDGEF